MSGHSGPGRGGGSGAVDSFAGRTGSVVATAGDYGSDEITNDSGVAGATVTAALDAVAAAASPISSVFGRTGVVAAATSDYDASQVDNDSGVTGATVAAALNTLNAAIAALSYNASDIGNDSGVTGADVAAALDALAALITVSSVHGRTGAVTSAVNDYNTDEIQNLSGVTGATVTAALNALDGGGGGAVDSVFGRTGAVVATSGDYGSNMITNQSGVTGATVSAALDALDGATAPVTSVFGRTGVVAATSGDYGSDEITNDSAVTGSTVTAALNQLNALGSNGYPYFVEHTTGDQRSAIQTAVDDAETDGGGEVWLDRGIHKISSTSGLDDSGNLAGLIIPPMVYLRGQGAGNLRSGGVGTTGQNAPTELMSTVTSGKTGNDYVVVSISNATPHWSGAGVEWLHIEDDAGYANALLNCAGINGIQVLFCSFGKNELAGSKCIRIQQAPNGSTTQYGRIWNCNIYAWNHGIWFEDNAPDWEITGCQIQHEGGTTPVSGSTGVYVASSAIRIIGGEIQMFDIGVHLDGTSGEAKHCTIAFTHFEGHQNAAANAYEAAVKLESNAGNAGMFALIIGAECGNPSKFQDHINIGTNTEGTNIQHWRVRGSKWLQSTDTDHLTDNGTDTIVSQ